MAEEMVELKEYECTIYYSTFIKIYVDATNPDEALKKAREQGEDQINLQHMDFRANAEPWEECDEVSEA